MGLRKQEKNDSSNLHKKLNFRNLYQSNVRSQPNYLSLRSIRIHRRHAVVHNKLLFPTCMLPSFVVARKWGGSGNFMTSRVDIIAHVQVFLSNSPLNYAQSIFHCYS